MGPGTEQSTVDLGRRRPEQYQSITEILYNTRTYHYSLVSVCGVVTFIQPAASTRGTDFQLTFTLADQDGAIVKVKFFRKEKLSLPWIQRMGDVVFLRNIKVTSFGGQVLLVSNLQTEFHVFPKEWICEPWYRQKYMTDLVEQASCSSGTYTLEAHMQQWAITLRNQYGETYPDEQPKRRFDGPVMAEAPLITTTDTHEAGRVDLTKTANASIAAAVPRQAFSINTNLSGSSTFANNTTAISTFNNGKSNSTSTFKDKFSMIKDIRIQGSGSFYDLVGEVVKIFYSPRNDITELYITDYTENTILRDYQPDDIDTGSQSSSNFPRGCRTLRVDLFSPHSYWANQNISVGHYVSLKNVRLKWSSNQEAEGSVWKDHTYPDRLGVFLLTQSETHWDMLVEQKRAYGGSISNTFSTSSNQPLPTRLSKKRRKRDRQKLKMVVGKEQHDSCEDTALSSAEPRSAAPSRWNPNGMSTVMRSNMKVAS